MDTTTTMTNLSMCDGSVACAMAKLTGSERHLIALAPAMATALRAVLMFYHAPYWGDAERAQWEAIIHGEATTKAMCDHIRALLATLDGAA